MNGRDKGIDARSRTDVAVRHQFAKEVEKLDNIVGNGDREAKEFGSRGLTGA